MTIETITVQIKVGNQEIRGSFRALVSSLGVDVLVLGNKDSSILFKLSEVDVQSIVIKHDGKNHDYDTNSKKTFRYKLMMNGTTTNIETFELDSTRQSYFILTSLYLKYKEEGKACINTDSFKVYTPYSIKNIGISTKGSESFKAKNEDEANTTGIPDRGCALYRDRNTMGFRSCRDRSSCVAVINTKPNVQVSNKISEFLNDLLGGKEYGKRKNNRKQVYIGQLISGGRIS